MQFNKLLLTFFSLMCVGFLFTGCSDDDENDDNPYGIGSYEYDGSNHEVTTGTLAYRGISNGVGVFDLYLPSSSSNFVIFRLYSSGSTLTAGVYTAGSTAGKFSPGSYVQLGNENNRIKLVSGTITFAGSSAYAITINCKDANDKQLTGSYMGELRYVDESGEDPDPGTTEPTPGNPVSDVDGNTYKTVIIGSVTWMAENLKTTKYNDGGAIPKATGGGDDSLDPRYSWYNNDSKIGETYGALYNFYAVETGKLCPAGWHVPTNNEWEALVTAVGGMFVGAEKLKEKGNAHWQNSSNSNATNESGFTALPGGCWMDYFSYHELGQTGNWWTSTLNSSGATARMRVMGYDNPSVSDAQALLDSRFSVRCVKDK